MTRAALMLMLMLVFSSANATNPLLDERYCGEPKRDAKGHIIRRADVLYAFQKQHPCPATGLTTGACKGWQKDHIIPLIKGGCDAVSNLQWLPVEIKTCKENYCKDRFEQKVY